MTLDAETVAVTSLEAAQVRPIPSVLFRRLVE